MSGLYLFMVILPILTYVLVHRFFDLKKAIISALAVAYCLAGLDAYIVGSWDSLLLSELGLLSLLGILSIRLNNQRFFRFQPVIANIIFLIWLSWLQWFDQPIMIKYLPRLQAISPQFVGFGASEQAMQLLANTSLGIILTLCLHTPLVAFFAARSSDSAWFFARLAIYPMLLIVTITVSAMH